MQQYQTEEQARLRREHTNRAIALAMESRWEEAIIANKAMIEIFPTDVDACNRLGKALTELGRYVEAREAYNRALEIDPNNTIAKKNLSRLAHLREAKTVPREETARVTPHIFIEEMGKTGLTDLHRLAPREVLARVAAGDRVYLRIRDHNLVVESIQGEYLGQVEPKLGQRLIKLMEGGNKYVAAIASLGENGTRLIIKEVFQHPSQAGRVSFPSRVTDDFRPYVKDSLLRYELEEDEEIGEEGYTSEWEDEAESHEGFSLFTPDVEPVVDEERKPLLSED